MEGLGRAPARTEADLRATLAELARRAPSADDALSAVREAGCAPAAEIAAAARPAVAGGTGPGADPAAWLAAASGGRRRGGDRGGGDAGPDAGRLAKPDRRAGWLSGAPEPSGLSRRPPGRRVTRRPSVCRVAGQGHADRVQRGRR